MVTVRDVAGAVRAAIPRAAMTLRLDVADALTRALATERSERGRGVLRQLLDNAGIAAADGVPICQDTGTVRVRLVVGSEERLGGDLQGAVDEAVASAYVENPLRQSVVRDALFERANTGDNTPAWLTIETRRGHGVRVDVMLKGGGSDNASVLAMLPPSAGAEGVRRVVLETVEAKATAACPPLVVAVAVGGTFDTVAGMAEWALVREVGSTAADERHAAFERELLADVNATGIGPAGLGGSTTALAVHLVTAPCHIAALPVAVALGCCAMRSASVDLA